MGIQTVEKPLSLLKMGCLALLALLVLHRAKLLASNQSILALGVAPRQVAGTAVPVFSPFPGKGGRGIGIENLLYLIKNRLFLQAESSYSKTVWGLFFVLFLGQLIFYNYIGYRIEINKFDKKF